ncbi:type II toxin-antitoxin system VapC family toxin [Desertifilum sp. FACHB-1129]|uniref:Ribonuclease VapC n=2 Tax=Desertifilum tharense IPPAS B-1220 TaxID=1781255 RepID=A0A1E5QMB8_9CYAN|nr:MULTISPECIES: type II toxin-antitoxin system VapC family toxin [Desertifilum]MCD8488526.1 type II toxin-antitoxin system VapC family toxin [Desertifilum sp.]MDA0212708.1 type II toxin-antitoxin system VapC family toxin [Cyanobacteria bacterium FC1]MBD2313320.1 type II toxin-antitoxin system VapC family toxin [Desertifilum sp. FACHB-1129]MBD2324391.1 type II toxin-antitoxin system VapC family toxin [Desertifilum sp. FACHB-866]MBD2334405.1 type II toxin-antitoxin system VapC family toxin [Des
MNYLLDTNVCIIYLKGRNLNLKQRLEATPVQEIAICSIVKAELCFGAMKSANPERNFALQQKFLTQFVSLPFDDLAATTFGVIRSQLETNGTPIGAYDLQIAAIALTNNLTLVTHNTREFERVEGLQIEDWEIEA